MSIRQFRPMTAATRFRSVSGFDEITRATPEKSLVEPLPQTGGRNNQGHVTLRHRGGGHKRQYRRIDFKREKFGIPGPVAEIEYDPNRTARIALLVYADGEKRYILEPKGLKQGDRGGRSGRGQSTWATPCRWPRCRWARRCTTSSSRSARVARSPDGRRAQVVAREHEYVTLRLRSRRKCASCTSAASPRLAKLGTASMSCSRSARPARAAGSGSVRMSAASR